MTAREIIDILTRDNNNLKSENKSLKKQVQILTLEKNRMEREMKSIKALLDEPIVVERVEEPVQKPKRTRKKKSEISKNE